MHPEIEKLIDYAIADGQITEKERNVILKKAAELGVDTDEVEMVLDGKLHQLEASKPKQKEKVGDAEKLFDKHFGVSVQIKDKTGKKLVPNEITIGQASREEYQ